MSTTTTPTAATRGSFSYNSVTSASAHDESDEQVSDVALSRLSASSQPKIAVQDRAGEEGVAEVAQAAVTWIDNAFLGVDNFVLEHPLAALVMAVVFGIFGLSQILPSFLGVILTGGPLCYASYRMGKAMWNNWERFTQALAENAMQGAVNQMQHAGPALAAASARNGLYPNLAGRV